MLKNYFKIALRNLWKNKSFSAINIVGLAAGLAVCLSIVLFVFDELSYDKYSANASRTYRIDADLFYNGTRFLDASSPKPMAYTLVKEYPQIEQMVRLQYNNDILVKKGNETVQDHHAVRADSTFFKVFPMPLAAGDPNTALNDPTAIVIDESTAKRYFNSTDVIGKTLYVDNSVYCKITAVMKDFPRQSHFHFSFIRPLRDNYPGESDAWLSNNLKSYILLKPGVTQQFAQSKINQIVATYVSRQLEQVVHASIKDLESRGSYFHYNLIPLTDIHLRSNKSSEFEANGNMSYVYIFSIIAALIMLIACVNFMNLSTARSANRAKEVGIRKVAGSLRGHLITQFLTESVLLSFIALILSLGFVALLLPYFNQLAGKQMQFSSLFAPGFLAVLIGLVFLVGLLAGSYPAFYLSSFQPIQVLKGKLASGFKNSWLRSSLVVFQFSISIILIIGTVVIYNQLQFIRNRKIGYTREQVLVLHNTYNLGKSIKTFRQELLNYPGVSNATMAGNLPTSGPGTYNQNGWFRDPSLDARRGIIFAEFEVDENYQPTLGMEIVQGRNFSHRFPTDSSGVLINETAIRMLGVKDPMNLILYRPGDKGGIPYHVVGVVKDFNFSSMREQVGPLIMRLSENWGSIALRVSTRNVSGLIGQIENKWKGMAPGLPFSYSFMDKDFDEIYHSEQRMGRIFITFAFFAILIACLGLFGLVTFAAEQRTKEIGIRKVLGANVGGIVVMLSSDFAKLVLIASIIAFPIAWWAMSQWLQGFAYRVSIGWWVFVVAGSAAMVIALLTVSVQTVRAALANPVKSLKSE